MKKVVWDNIKNRSNIKKHDVSFEDAATVFFDSLSITVPDEEIPFMSAALLQLERRKQVNF